MQLQQHPRVTLLHGHPDYHVTNRDSTGDSQTNQIKQAVIANNPQILNKSVITIINLTSSGFWKGP